MECSIGGSVLFNLILELMLSKTSREKEENNVSSTEALGTYAAKMNQLQLLNEILWRNSISLTSKRYNLNSSDLATLKFYLRLYTSAIDKANIECNIYDLIAIAAKKQGTRATDIERKLQIDYLQPLEELHRACDEMNAIDEENAGEEESMLQRGRTWMLLGYIQLLLFGNLDPIDPVHKMELKLKYFEEDIVDCKNTMYVATLQNRILGISAENEYAHPKLAATRNCEIRLLKTKDELGHLEAFRPLSVDFAMLREESTNFRNEVASYKLVEKHANSLCAVARKIRQNCDSADLIIAETTWREAESWSLSVRQFAEQIEAKYLSAYPDVIIPLLTALTQLRHGVCILINEIRRLMRRSTITNLESLIHNLLRFPTIDQQQDSLPSLSDLRAFTSARELISKNLRSADAFVRMREQFELFKMSLLEAHNYLILNRCLTKSQWLNINEILQQIVLIWNQQQQEEEMRATERDSLYRNKTKHHRSTKENDEFTLIQKMFPMHHEKDFDDIDDIESGATTSPHKNSATAKLSESNGAEETELSLNGLITKDDIKEIQQIHSDIVISFIASKWICNNRVSIEYSTNYIESLMQKYNIVYGIVKDIPNLSDRLTTKLYNSLNMLVAVELNQNKNETLWKNAERREKVYNFYNDSNIEAVKECLPICHNILNSVDELSKTQWNKPILKTIRRIIEKIYTFPIVSPVSRFLRGFEVLLEKMLQWKQGVHSDIRMTHHISVLRKQIISWHKLEQSCWKVSLNTVYKDLRSDTSKWWFFLYGLVEKYAKRSAYNVNSEASAEPSITKPELVETLKRFMTESSFVEFEARLDLLLTFHCHVYYLDNDDKNEILVVLWNVYNFYKQFVDVVKAQIAAFKVCIERKINDVINKIVRFTGMNHKAVTRSLEASRCQIRICIKEYQNALKQSVSNCLIIKSESYSTKTGKVIWNDHDHCVLRDTVNANDFIVSQSPQSSQTVVCRSRLIKTGMLLEKAKELCKKIILASSYSYARSELENLVQDFMGQSARLRNTNIDENLSKNKQRSQAKAILQQKKTTLANYFKTLTRIGISHRVGALALKNNADKVMDFTIPPLDLSAIERYFNLNNIDQYLLKQWQGCEKYYYKSLIRLNALNSTFSRNCTDLDSQNVEYCRGYSAHMMLMAHKQKMTIAESFDQFSSFRIELANLSEAYKQDLIVSKQRIGQSCVENLKTLLMMIESGFEQLLLFFQCCPVESSADSDRAMLTLRANALPILTASQNDEIWKNAYALLKNGLDSIKAVAKGFHILFMPFQISSENCSVYPLIFNSRHFKFLEQSCTTIRDLRTRCKKLKQLFTSTDIEHPIWKSIAFLDTKMECFLSDFEHLRGSAELADEEQLKTGNAVEQYELAVEQLINVTLLVVEKKYKDYVNVNDSATCTDKDSEENILKEKLVESLEKDISELKLSKVSDLFFNLLLSIRELDVQSADYCAG